MKSTWFLGAAALAFAGCVSLSQREKPLFDGRTFAGWEGDTERWWKIENGQLTAGSLDLQFPRNEFLATRRDFTNFVLKLEFKLEGSEGFVNSGVQIRSQRVPNHHEMIGYQADIGEGWFGCIYDESRRNTVLARPSADDVKRAVRLGDWNHYEIRAEGPRVILRINGVLMVDYTEKDPAIPQFGKIGMQIHGGGKARVAFRNLSIQEL